MRELHLFAGIGGGILGGMLLGHRCVGAVERDPYCLEILRARQRDGLLPDFPLHDDVRTFDGCPWLGKLEVLAGGFPCQPWSSAGSTNGRRGTRDPRHLWPQFSRIVAECRPPLVFAENVSLAAMREPWTDLRRMGYRVTPAIALGPSDLGGSQSRDRWWLLAARTDDEGKRVVAEHAKMAAAPATTLESWERSSWWSQNQVPGSDDGTTDRVDRTRGTGNAQVPLVAATAFRILMAEIE